MSEPSNVRALQTSPKRGGTNGGNGNLVGHRLAELERRMEKIEGAVGGINDLCIQMNAKLDEKASKSYVLTIFALTGGLAVLSLSRTRHYPNPRLGRPRGPYKKRAEKSEISN